MKKGLLLIVMMVFGWVGAAGATTWTDTYLPDEIPLYMAEGDTTNVSFDIGNAGFDSNLWDDWSRDLALWAEVDLYVTDDLSRWYDPIDWFGADETLTVVTDGFFFDYNTQTYNVDFHGGILNDALGYTVDVLGLISLNLNGELDLMLTASEGDFNFWGAKITASDAAPVPEPGTLLLLGSGLAGLALYRRKKAAK